MAINVSLHHPPLHHAVARFALLRWWIGTPRMNFWKSRVRCMRLVFMSHINLTRRGLWALHARSSWFICARISSIYFCSAFEQRADGNGLCHCSLIGNLSPERGTSNGPWYAILRRRRRVFLSLAADILFRKPLFPTSCPGRNVSPFVACAGRAYPCASAIALNIT